MMMAFGEERENFFDFSFPRVFFLSPFSFPPPRKIQGTKKNERRRSKKKGGKKEKKEKKFSSSKERILRCDVCVCVCVRFPPLARFASIVSLRRLSLDAKREQKKKKRERRAVNLNLRARSHLLSRRLFEASRRKN